MLADQRFTIDGLTAVLLFSSLLYLLCVILAWRKLLLFYHQPASSIHGDQQEDSKWSTKKLLVLSAGLASFLRLLSFIGVAALNAANLKAHYSIHGRGDDASSVVYQSQDKYQGFYDGTLTVMFDLPNVVVVSTYVLLTIVWADCFIQSRFHTESTRVHRKRVLGAYMLFNTALYGTQTILYILVFATSNLVIRTALYVTVTGVNFTAVFLVFLLYVYLNVVFAGYPSRSHYLKTSLGQVSSLMALWTFSRIVWGIFMLLVFIYNVELLQDSETPGWSFLILLILFVVCEIFPLIALLDFSYGNIMGFETNASNDIKKLAFRMMHPSFQLNEENATTPSITVNDFSQRYGTVVEDLYGMDNTSTLSQATPLLRGYSENTALTNESR